MAESPPTLFQWAILHYVPALLCLSHGKHNTHCGPCFPSLHLRPKLVLPMGSCMVWHAPSLGTYITFFLLWQWLSVSSLRHLSKLKCCRYKRHPTVPFSFLWELSLVQAAMWCPQGMDYDWFKLCMISWCSLISLKVDVWSITGKGM